MQDLVFIPLSLVYFLVVVLLFLFGLNFFYLSYLAWVNRRSPIPPPPPQNWPAVTVQLPLFNEKYVAERLIRSAAELDYPPEQLEIQVLDDSTDETLEITRRLVSQLKAKGRDIALLHRPNRTGYKAGALSYGLRRARGEFVAIFDADFIPPVNFLKTAIPCFQDPRVGFVQSRWGHINRDYSFLTFLQSLAIDAHFMVEQHARCQGGYWFNFNGTAGAWRKSTILDSGGWSADTLTEDLDISYRAFLRGWQAFYVRELETPSELPANILAYRQQQQRWARGSLECAARHLPKVWESSQPLALKIQASFHLLGYLVQILLFLLALMYPLVVLGSQSYPQIISLFGLAVFLNFTALAPSFFFVLAQQQLGRRWYLLAPVVLLITSLGSGMMINTLRAALLAVRREQAAFERTPKYGLVSRSEHWLERAYQLKLDRIVFFEIFFALFNLYTLSLAAHSGHWIIALYTTLNVTGLVYVSGLTITHAVRSRRAAQLAPAQET